MNNQAQSDNIIKQVVSDKAFVITALILLISALGIDSLAKALQLTFIRSPVPLRKKLTDFSVSKMYPYQLVRKVKLDSEIEEALGTKDYLQLLFDDTSLKSQNAPGKLVSFFVTYYTGSLDQVPHVPDVCYQGGGYDPIGSDNTTIRIPGIGLPNDKLAVRILIFRNTRSIIPTNKVVVYFFSVNGEFKATRGAVRLALSDIRNKYAYFSKVEIAFGGVQPDRDKALELTAKFLKKALPLLMNEHWQNWDEFIKKESTK